jgi:hypothetical protein
VQVLCGLHSLCWVYTERNALKPRIRSSLATVQSVATAGKTVWGPCWRKDNGGILTNGGGGLVGGLRLAQNKLDLVLTLRNAWLGL